MDCGPSELIAKALRQLPACSRAQTLPGAMPKYTPSFITGELGGTANSVHPFPVDLRKIFLSKLGLSGILTWRY